MLVTTSCANGSLDVFQPGPGKTWDQQRVKHLYRRLGYGPGPDELETALEMAPDQLVDQLIDQALAQELPPPPEWAEWRLADYPSGQFNALSFAQVNNYITQWLQSMIDNGPREKLSLFWHNHFVTSYEQYNCPAYLYQYHRILLEHALGNFREMVRRIGTTPAMLVFLNGRENTKNAPNENYARELFELFTLGVNNGYTQEDIEEASRALTGWNYVDGGYGPIRFREDTFDSGFKTIFGQTGQFDHDGLIELLFEQRGPLIARFICAKIYRNFVHPVEDEAVIAQLATVLLQNDWELAPVFRVLLKSEHFFDDYNIGTLIKSPIDLIISLVREGGFPHSPVMLNYIRYTTFNLGQALFDPVDVAGWPGNRVWIDAGRLTGRWSAADDFVLAFYQQNPERMRQLAIQLTDNSNSPEVIVQALVDFFLPKGLSAPEAYDSLTDIFRWEVPQNYYDNGTWNLGHPSAPYQVMLTLSHLARYPEFQLA